MTTRKFCDTMPYSMDRVFQARETRYTDPSLWPELVGSQELERDEDEQRVVIVRDIEIRGDLPAAAAKIFSSSFRIREHLHYDRQGHSMHVRVEVLSYASLLDYDQSAVYSRIGTPDQPETRRDIHIDCHVKVPIVGKNLEKLMLDRFEKGLRQDRDNILKFCAAQQN